ncbi:MAG: T9SS type A sorting domain-containing protein [Bacteroidota bacterium]
MIRIYTLFCSLFIAATTVFGQVYVDQFENGDAAYMGGSATYSFSEANGELSITAAGPAPFDVFTYGFHNTETGEAVSVNATANNKVFVRAKASNIGVTLRMDLQDAGGFVTSQAGLSRILTTDFQVLEFDFTDLYIDGGFGGTSCDSGPCPVDGTNLTSLVFFTEPGIGGFNGTVVIDYIAFGEEPSGVIMSDVFQDHFESDSSVTSFINLATYDLSVNDNSELIVKGDGTNPMWDPLAYLIRNQTTYETIDIDVTGNNKMYVKIKSTVPNTTIRFDVIDIDGFANTQGSITKLVGTDFSVLEFDYAGTYIDLGFGGTPCTMETAPCPVNGERISQLNIFIEPGVGEFLGELTIDYISFGTPLEPAGPPAEFIYEDHFGDETLEYTSGGEGFVVLEVGSDLVITANGTAPPFSSVSYLLHDKESMDSIVLDLTPALNKVFIRARTESGSVPLRLDLIDTLGFITNQASLTKIIGEEFQTFEYNFTGNYFDGGFGGTPCDGGPCEVDGTIIDQLLLYLDPVQGNYEGTVYIDYVSIGQPAGDDDGGGVDPNGIVNYSEDIGDNTSLFISDVDGLVSTYENSEWTITGNGTSGAFSPLVYTIHDEAGEPTLADAVASNDKLFVRAKTSVAGTELRVDLQDVNMFVTNAAAVSNALTEEYAVYEIDYSDRYNDGGFGGSPCESGPCPVDGSRIGNLQFFINPGVGMFDGTVTIDWVAFGEPLPEDLGPTGVINYQEEFDENTLPFITDNTGYTSTTGETWTIVADGSTGAFTPLTYALHDETGEMISADVVGSSDLMYIRARATNPVSLRVDLQDTRGFVTNASSRAVDLTDEFEVYEMNYAGAYNDGGFGGTPCDAGPCPVDGQRISMIQLFANDASGGYTGTIEIDYIAFGSPLVNVTNINRLSQLKAFPNPVQNELNILLKTRQAGTLELRLFNAVGQLVSTKNVGHVNGNQVISAIDVSELAKGLYQVQVIVDSVSSGYVTIVK